MIKLLLNKYLFLKGAGRALKISAVITVVGISLSVAALVVSLSIAAGFEDAYKKSILDFNAHIMMTKDDGEISEYNELLNKLSMFDGVVGATPFVYRESMIIKKGVVKGAVIKGVDFDRLLSVSNIKIERFEDGESAFRHADAIFLGKALAERLGVTGPTDVNLLVGNNKFKKIRVTGIFESGLYDYDSQFGLMGLSDVQRLYGMKDQVSGIEVSLSDPDDAEEMTEMMRVEFDYPYQVTNWIELNGPIFEAVKLEKIVFGIIVGMMALVGIFNIIGTLVLRILYKLRDISVLSALGLEGRLIRRLFTCQGVSLGVFASVIGVFLGLTATWIIGRFELIRIEPEIYFLSHLPMKIEWSMVSIVLLTAVFIAWFTSYLASGRIASLNISENLK